MTPFVIYIEENKKEKKAKVTNQNNETSNKTSGL